MRTKKCSKKTCALGSTPQPITNFSTTGIRNGRQDYRASCKVCTLEAEKKYREKRLNVNESIIPEKHRDLHMAIMRKPWTTKALVTLNEEEVEAVKEPTPVVEEVVEDGPKKVCAGKFCVYKGKEQLLTNFGTVGKTKEGEPRYRPICRECRRQQDTKREKAKIARLVREQLEAHNKKGI